MLQVVVHRMTRIQVVFDFLMTNETMALYHLQNLIGSVISTKLADYAGKENLQADESERLIMIAEEQSSSTEVESVYLTAFVTH